jgi:RecA-family ATPase
LAESDYLVGNESLAGAYEEIGAEWEDEPGQRTRRNGQDKEAPNPAEVPVLKIYSGDVLAKESPKPRRWLVPSMIAMMRACLLYGDGGAGKSILLTQLGVAIAAQVDWLGKLIEGDNRRALIISTEDDRDEFQRRLHDVIAGREDINPDNLVNLKFVDLVAEENIELAELDPRGDLKTTPLFMAIERLVAEFRPALLGIDTTADVFGGDEIKRTQVKQFVGCFTRLAVKYRMAVLLLAHPSQAGMASGTGTSGNTAWNNSVRSRLYFSKVKPRNGEDDSDDIDTSPLMQLQVMKSNYGPKGEKIAVKWNRGRYALVNAGSFDKAVPESQADRVFLTLVDKFQQERRDVSPNPSVSPVQPAPKIADFSIIRTQLSRGFRSNE